MQPIRTILHPTDFSKHAKTAFELACSMARDHNAKLIVLHVVPSHEPVTHYAKAMGFEPPESAQVDLKGYREEMERKLQSVKPKGAKVAVEHMLKEGVIGKVIVQTVEQTPCDLVVMGTRGQSPPSKALFGSVAEEVARNATCPVIVVQTPAK